MLANLFHALADYKDAFHQDISLFESQMVPPSEFPNAEELLRLQHQKNALKSLKQKYNKKFHVIAHSMGNRMLKHTIRKINESRPNRSVFSSIHSVAADISLKKMRDLDGNLFVESINVDDQSANGNVFVYYSTNDGALDASKFVRCFAGRLDLKKRLGRKARELNADGIKIVDCTEASIADDPGNKHSYLLRRDKYVDLSSVRHRHTQTLQAILNNIRFGTSPTENGVLVKAPMEQLDIIINREGEAGQIEF